MRNISAENPGISQVLFINVAEEPPSNEFSLPLSGRAQFEPNRLKTIKS
jgi:hypothetical protein